MMSPTLRRTSSALSALVAGCLLLGGTCGPRGGFVAPDVEQLSLVGTIDVELRLPGDPDPGTLVVTLDGIDVTSMLTVNPPDVSGPIAVASAGNHTLEATASFSGDAWRAKRPFVTVVLQHPDECETSNDAECLLPYPSSRFLVPAATPTGVRLDLPQVAMPVANGPVVSPQPFNELDGFSPGVQIQMHFPQGVDPERSGAARLLAPGCCDQPTAPPWIHTRTYDDRSLEADSPSVLLDAATGERIVHFIEVDEHAAGNPARQVLYLRPGKALTPGHRYIVAMRGLKDPTGAPVEAEPVFAAVRDARTSTIPAVQDKAAYLEAHVFPALEAFDVERSDLVLAFDFVVQSDHQLTRQALAMRDQAFAWLDSVEANPNGVSFSVSSVVERDCSLLGTSIWREVTGTFESPLFLTGDPATAGWVQFANVDANDVPVQNGFVSRPFTIGVPCTVLDASAPVARPVLGGPGAGELAENVALNITRSAHNWGDGSVSFIGGATDWQMLQTSQQAAFAVFSIGFGTNALNNVPATADRTRQEVLDALVLGRMMKRGLFNRDPAFQTPAGRDVFPGPTEELYLHGTSLGGGLGLMLAALSPDVARVVAHEPATSWPWLFRRNEQWPLIASFFDGIALTDPMQLSVWLGLWHELWVSAGATGYLGHINRDPLPGAGAAKPVLMQTHWLDRSVANIGTERAARSLGLFNVEGSAQAGMPQIPDVPNPAPSGLMVYDSSFYELFDPALAHTLPPLGNLPPTPSAQPGCDPHQAAPPARLFQYVSFLQPAGQVESFCEGVCDASAMIEDYPLLCTISRPPSPVTFQNATTLLRIFGGGAHNGVIGLSGFHDYRDLATGPTSFSTDPILVFDANATSNLAIGRRGGFGAPQDLGTGVARSTATAGGIAVEADTELVGKVGRTTFRFTSGQPMDGVHFIFYVESDIADFTDDVASFSGSIGTGDLELFQIESASGGLTVRLAGQAQTGASLAAFGSGQWGPFGFALEQEGDLTALSADGSNFQTEGDLGLALAFSLQGTSATVVVEYGAVP